MSRYVPDHSPEPVFQAVEHWKTSCLLQGGSLFGSEKLWSLTLLDELKHYFVENPDESKSPFLEKLKGQMAKASKPAIHLMAELLWVLLLFPSNIRSETKRAQVREVWGWSGFTLDESNPYLHDEILGGFGNAGQGYNYSRPDELAYLILVVYRLLSLPEQTRVELLGDAWKFASWLDALPETGSRQFRHILLFLLFPDSFERMSTLKDKMATLKAFLPKDTVVDGESMVKVDQWLADVRKSEEAKSDTSVDFYVSPWKERWSGSKPNQPSVTDPVASPSRMLVEKPRNLIFYGPPGTGKTYRLTQLIQEKGYEAELAKISEKEWLSVNLADVPWWAVVFMALRDLNRPVKVDEILNHKYFKVKAGLKTGNNSLRATVWSSLQSHTVEGSATVKTDGKWRTAPFVFNKSEQGLWYLSGDWTESCSQWVERAEKIANGLETQGGLIKRYEFVTFHQSYSYEDFIEGIRPQPGEEGQGVSYAVLPGVFRRLCERARQDPAHRYAIFIDEINRGNISKIFGELITLIELDKRAEYDAQGNLVKGMEVTLPYSGDSFGVPRNLDIYGSMNTADRSIALLDTALRRRFKFHELMPDSELVPGQAGDGYIPDGEGGLINLRALMKTLNRRIAYLLNRDQTIGHAFFTKVRDIHELRSVICDEIIPLLQEYFYNDWQRIRMVFGYHNQTTGFQIISQETESSDQVFGWADDELASTFRYRICQPDEISADAIRRIIGTSA